MQNMDRSIIRRNIGNGVTLMGIGIIIIGLAMLIPLFIGFIDQSGGIGAAGILALTINSLIGIGVLAIGTGCIIIGRNL